MHTEYENWRGCPYDERESGLLLERLHSLTPSGSGPIDDWGQVLFGDWTEFLTRAARAAIRTAQERQAIPIPLAERLATDWVPALDEVSLAKPAPLNNVQILVRT